MAHKKTGAAKQPNTVKKDLQGKIDKVMAKAGVSRKTLEKTPGRVLKLLRGFAVPAIQRALRPLGFNQSVVDQGWELLKRSLGHSSEGEESATPEVAEAVRALDTSDEKAFRRVRGSLRAKHPSILATLTAGIAPSTGFQAVFAMKVLNDRLDELEKSKEPAATAALAKLASNGIDAHQRNEWKALLKTAGTVLLVDNDAALALDLKRVEGLLEARDFWLEWADFAQSAITRKDLLIRLGLAARKSPEEQEKDEEGEEDAEDDGNDDGDPDVDNTDKAPGPSKPLDPQK